MEWVDVYRDFNFFRRMEMAVTWDELTKGLLERTNAGDGMLLLGARHVHTYQMKFPIDIVYLNLAGFVIGLDEFTAPNKTGKRFRETEHIAEFHAGTILSCQIVKGERWHWKRTGILS